MEGQTITRSAWLCIALVVLAGLVARALAFAPFDISHADEIMQYLEQGKRLATGHGIVPWEYRYGARNELIPQLLAVPFWLGAKLAPGTLGGMLSARWLFLGLTLLALPAAWKLGGLTSRTHALAALFVAAVWYENVLFSTLLLSEVLGAALIAMAAALLLADAPSRAALRWAGLLLGLGVLVRLQYAPFAAVLVLARLRTDWRMWGQVLLGGLGALAIGVVSDLIAGQVPLRWIWVNLSYNMGQGRAARFGASGPLEYLRLLLVHLGPAAPLIMAGAVLSPPSLPPAGVGAAGQPAVPQSDRPQGIPVHLAVDLVDCRAGRNHLDQPATMACCAARTDRNAADAGCARCAVAGGKLCRAGHIGRRAGAARRCADSLGSERCGGA